MQHVSWGAVNGPLPSGPAAGNEADWSAGTPPGAAGRSHAALIVTQVSRKSALMTDQGEQDFYVGKEFDRHETVNYAANEYVRGDAHTNTAECRFSLMRRAVFGAHHSISEAHLHRYLTEWKLQEEHAQDQ
jgi:hypothetical protein